MIGVTSHMDEPEIAIAPEPDEGVRAAVRRALAAPEPAPGRWGEVALVEGVSGGDAEPLQQHDVCSLW